jgi:CRP-like cAMP-binding protein/small-conductance mechanosensitive channel
MLPSFAQFEATVPAELEGLLAFLALLVAFALRRRKRILTPIGFILLSLGLITDALVRSIPRGEWTRWGHAAALTLIFWAAVQMFIEGTHRTLVRGRAHFSTATVDIIRAILYLTVPVLILRFEVHLDFRVLGVLSTIPAGGALAGWFVRSEFLKTLVLQSQKPAKPGDWVKFDDHIGRIQWTGWRATRILTTGNESLHIPNSVLSQRPLLNFSAAEQIEDHLQIELGSYQSPWKVEELVLGLLRDEHEVLAEPPPSIELCGFRGDNVQYQIKYWLSDYAQQNSIRARLLRHLWYAGHRNSLKISTNHDEPQTGTREQADHTDRMLVELGRSCLLRGLNDEELKLLMPSTRIVEFGTGEVIIHDGEVGNTFYVLLRGRVEVLERDSSGQLRVIRQTEDRSEDNFFGEIALLTGEPRTTTIRALTDLEVLEVDREGFSRLFKAKPDAASTIADVAAKRMEETRLRSSKALQPTVATNHWLLATMRQLFDF